MKPRSILFGSIAAAILCAAGCHKPLTGEFVDVFSAPSKDYRTLSRAAKALEDIPHYEDQSVSHYFSVDEGNVDEAIARLRAEFGDQLPKFAKIYEPR